MRKKIISLAIFSLSLLRVSPVLAQENPIQSPIEPPGHIIEDLGKMIGAAIQIMLVIAGLATFLYLVLGGFAYITSGGDKTAVESAKNKLTYAFIGFFIIVLAWAITKLLGYLFGIDIFDLSNLPKFY